MSSTKEKVDCITLGAGIAGITAAKKLVAAGRSVCLLEKSRGIGGRFATRRIDGESFDHGAQFFTAREDEFKTEVQQWLVDGIARPWFGDPGHERYCGVGGMNQLTKELAEGLDVRREQKVEWIGFENGVWSVRSSSGTFEGDRLLLTNPAPQAVDLLQTSKLIPSVEFIDTLKTIKYGKCISLMLLLKAELGLSASGMLKVESGEPIATVTETKLKGITERPGIVIQSGPEFADANFDASSESIFKRLTDALPFAGRLKVEGISLQKWRFAKRKDHDLRASFLRDESISLWHAGDGYVAPRIEGAFLSGDRVADSILESFGTKSVGTSQNTGEQLHAG